MNPTVDHYNCHKCHARHCVDNMVAFCAVCNYDKDKKLSALEAENAALRKERDQLLDLEKNIQRQIKIIEQLEAERDTLAAQLAASREDVRRWKQTHLLDVMDKSDPLLAPVGDKDVDDLVGWALKEADASDWFDPRRRSHQALAKAYRQSEARLKELARDNLELIQAEADENTALQAAESSNASLLKRLELAEKVVESAQVWRTHHVCCPKGCPDLKDAQKSLGDALDKYPKDRAAKESK